MAETKPIFRPLDADDPDPECTKIESLCVNCQKNGTTQILLTRIPFYKEVVLMSFECEHCGYRNNEIQPGGQIEEKGIRIILNVAKSSDLNRQVCKSDYTSVKIPELDFEIPPLSQKGEITTVEGIIDRSVRGLEESQKERMETDPENAEKIKSFVEKLKKLKTVETPFTLIIEDISGNSFVSNPQAPARDPEVTVSHFSRNRDQDHALGIFQREEIAKKQEDENDDDDDEERGENSEPGILKPAKTEDFTYEKIIGEVMQFQTNCYNCNSPCETNMKMTKIPHFKEVIIMATNCEACGHRSNEVKSGGGIEPEGIRIEVTVSEPEDLTRDVLKSETCRLEIPDLDLEVGSAALGGRFTTVEGILSAMKEQLVDSEILFRDSRDEKADERLNDFIGRFDSLLGLEKPFRLILEDPAGNSYVQNVRHPEPDGNLKIIKFVRSFEQNEELGLNDMKVDNFD